MPYKMQAGQDMSCLCFFGVYFRTDVFYLKSTVKKTILIANCT